MPTKLKSLELQGYKTFASRTEFGFSDKITAIVGPNGSGKSNIADAMRWVLGEQSFSLLRGKRTEDMIFAGSEQRTRAGMASATITFDNEDGWLPIDFSEVAITRRAYRDGQNEYLVNGQRVRLRDVAELLSKSGLAERTYTIIGQGLVDAALALNAEERRRLFEEAAGIGFHRSRREESVRRLDNTRRNLERVQDILLELEPRLRSLERQARRVIEYDQVRADLNVILREWYGYYWHITQKEVNDSREMVQYQEINLDDNRHKQRKASDLLNQTRQKIQDLRVNVAQLHHQLSVFHSRRETLSKDLAVGEERGHGLSIQIQNLDTDHIRLEQELLLHQERVESSRKEVQRYEGEVYEASEKKQVVLEDLKIRQHLRSKIELGIQDIRSELGKRTAREEHINARQAASSIQLETQRAVVEKLEAGLEKIANDLQRKEEFSRVKELKLKQIQEERNVIETNIEALAAQISEVETTRKRASDALVKIQTETAGLQAQLNVLLEAEKSLVGYTQGTQALLQGLQKLRNERAVGTLSSNITVPEQYEVAISAALGELLDAVILREFIAVEDAFKVLRDSNSRAVLIPMNNVRGKKGSNLHSELIRYEGVIGKALDFVSAVPEVQEIIQLLLDDIYLVHDRHVALKILEDPVLHQEGHSILLVTLSGDVFHWSGVIQFGRDVKSGLLSRARQIRNLGDEIKESNKAEQARKEDMEYLTKEINKYFSLMDELRDQLRVKAKQNQSANNEYNQEVLSLEQLRRSYAWQQEQKSTLERELNEGKSLIQKSRSELEHITGEVQQLREQIRLENIKLAESALDELQEQVAHWNTRYAVAERALQDARGRLSERVNTLNQTIKYQADLATRQLDIHQALDQLSEKKKSSILEQKQINNEIETLSDLIRPVEENLEILEAQQQDLQADEAETRQSLTQAEHYYAQARIVLVRKQEELDNLRRRIEDDFGLVEFKYDDRISGQTTLPIEGMVEQLPVIYEVSSELQENIKRYRGQLRRIGSVNSEARTEYNQVKERYDFLVVQVADLKKAEEDVNQVIAELDMLMQRDFKHTFDAVDKEFRQVFARLFGGGSAKLVLTDPDNIADTGIDIEARLPGRREQWLSLLSGGERSLTAAALIFALIIISPTPFCVLDEVDAMLDEANVGRFRELLQELSQTTQFVIVTHNRNTVQAADTIYGVTMGKDSCSQVISLKLDDVEHIVP